MAPLSGNGSERLVRYFYNSSTQECESFIYSGKGGNGNNFLSSTKCERTCKDGKHLFLRDYHPKVKFSTFLDKQLDCLKYQYS